MLRCVLFSRPALAHSYRRHIPKHIPHFARAIVMSSDPDVQRSQKVRGALLLRTTTSSQLPRVHARVYDSSSTLAFSLAHLAWCASLLQRMRTDDGKGGGALLVPARPAPLVSVSKGIPEDELQAMRTQLEAEAAVREGLLPRARECAATAERAVSCLHCGQYEEAAVIVEQASAALVPLLASVQELTNATYVRGWVHGAQGGGWVQGSGHARQWVGARQ